MAPTGKIVFEWNDDGVVEFLHNDTLAASLKAMAEQGAQWARDNAPVVTGRYRDSIDVEMHNGKSRVSARVIATDQKAHWIEYGNVNLPPRRILGKSLDHMRGGG